MYIDAYFDRDKNKILVSEVHNGKTISQEFRPEYFFYIEDPKGKYESVYGDKLARLEYKEYRKFLGDLKKYKKMGKRTYEGNVRPLFKTLERHYKNQKKEQIKKTFFDIEVDFDQEKGYSPPEDPFNRITAITLYNSWEDTLYSLSLHPTGMTMEEAERQLEGLENNLICDSEAQMLTIFFELTKETNVYSGWNCMPLTNNIWAKDGIYKLENIPNELIESNVINRFPVSKKKKFGIKTFDNSEIFSSKDHKFDCYIIDDGDYHTDLVIRPEKLTDRVRKFFFENKLYEKSHSSAVKIIMDEFNMSKTYAGSLYQLYKGELKRGVLNDFYIKSPRNSGSPEYKLCSVEEIQNLLQEGKMVFIDKIINANTNVDSKLYSDDELYLAGLIYTDGSITRKGKKGTEKYNGYHGYTIYQSDLRFMSTIKTKFSLPNKIIGPYKNNYSIKIHWNTISKNAHDLIYDSNLNKKMNIELLSKLSKRQFLIFLSGLLDGDGYISNSKNGNNCLTWCNHINDIKTMNELCDWNGIQTTRGESVKVRFTTLSTENLSILKESRFSKFENKGKRPYGEFIDKSNKAKAKQIKWKKIDENKLRVRITEIKEYDEFVDMMDIETDTHRFVCSSFITHNCESFDIPYMVNRTRRILGNEATKNFCLWNKFPVKRMFEKYGKEQETYDFIGKIHMDMMLLYQKYTYSEQPSYRLDYIGELEIGENKVVYEGTLDQLYNNDYRKFIDYARQDTMMLVKLDKKLDHINLAFTIAHDNLVDIKTVMGSVALIDNAIVLEAHRRNMITRDKEQKVGDHRIAGAWVADPKVGLQENIAINDLTSLYPSVFRALNLGNETIVAQIEHTITKPMIEERMGGDPDKFAQAWAGIFWIPEVDEVLEKTDKMLLLSIEDGETTEISAKEIYDFVFDNGFIITANGTIIRNDKQSIISSLLERWFNERITYQKRAKTYARLVEGLEIPDSLYQKLKERL